MMGAARGGAAGSGDAGHLGSGADATHDPEVVPDLVYERAKATKGDEPFGTDRDVNAIGFRGGTRSGPASPTTSIRGFGWAAPTARSHTTFRCSTCRR
jgi:hypothetical protein